MQLGRVTEPALARPEDCCLAASTRLQTASSDVEELELWAAVMSGSEWVPGRSLDY